MQVLPSVGYVGPKTVKVTRSVYGEVDGKSYVEELEYALRESPVGLVSERIKSTGVIFSETPGPPRAVSAEVFGCSVNLVVRIAPAVACADDFVVVLQIFAPEMMVIWRCCRSLLQDRYGYPPERAQTGGGAFTQGTREGELIRGRWGLNWQVLGRRSFCGVLSSLGKYRRLALRHHCPNRMLKNTD